MDPCTDRRGAMAHARWLGRAHAALRPPDGAKSHVAFGTDEELVADDDDPWPSLEEMYVMLIDRVVEKVMIRTAGFYMHAAIEGVISIRYGRICKYEAMAVACREVLEERRLRLVEHPSWCGPFQDACV